MAEDKSRYWSPTRTYEFELTIGEEDMTDKLNKVTILTSIDMPYQTFILDIYTEPNEFILNEIYGQKAITLTSILLATDEWPLERVTYDLMYLDSEMPITVQVDDPSNMQVERFLISIAAVGRRPYITMNKTINRVYQGSKIEDVITDMVSNTSAKDFKYDNQGRNTDIIDQILVPPSTFYKNVKYLNQTFGIFNGAMALFCLHDNVIHLKNLTDKMKNSHTFTIYQLSLDGDNTDIFNKCVDGKTFYTVKDVESSYKGNAAFSVLAPTIWHVVKPRNKLSEIIPIHLETFAQTYGLISKNNKIFYDKQALTASTRLAVHSEHTGYDESETFINARYSKKVSAITEMNIVVEQSMQLLNLMNVGDAVFYNSKTTDINNLTDKYILRSSELTFTLHRDWTSSAKLNLIRTNRDNN